MEKVPGVASVRVSLNEGLTVLDLTTGNSVTLSNLRQIIRNNGFVTKDAQVVVKGTVTGGGAQLTLDVSGSHEKLVLSAGAGVEAPYNQLRERVRSNAAGEVVVSGTTDLTDPKAIKMRVTAIQP